MANLENQIEAPKLDSVFGNRAEKKQKSELGELVNAPLEDLYDFDGHPFGVRDDDAMMEMADSIKERGVLVPGLARPRPAGGYQIVAGHRRKRGSQLAGKSHMPILVRELDDDSAIIIMVDSNIQREDILPSEKAKAFKMKSEALERKRGRPTKENCAQVGHNSPQPRTRDIIAEEAGESKSQISRYIQLNNLVPELLDMVDTKDMAFTPAVEIASLQPEEQEVLADLVKLEGSTPSLSQAQRLKKLSKNGELNEETMLSVLTERKPQQKMRVVLKEDRLSRYFPKNYTPKQIEDTIFKLLDSWYKKRQREQQQR